MDQRLSDLARSSVNFGHLFSHSPLLALYGAQAEAIVFTDSNAALVHTRQFGEVLAEVLLTRAGLRVAGDKQVHRVQALANAGLVPSNIRTGFDTLRQVGNHATHRHMFDTTRALQGIRVAWELGTWLNRTLTGDRTVTAFVPPVAPVVVDPAEVAALQEALEADRAALAESQLRLSEISDLFQERERARVIADSMVNEANARHEALRAENEALLAEMARLRGAQEGSFKAYKAAPKQVSALDRATLVDRARRPAPLNEAQARRVIDQQLAEAGWLVQDMRELNPLAGRGVAVREFRLASGSADYVLYVDGKIVGVIEAKREGETLSAAQAQNARYAAGTLKEHALAVWHKDEPLVFRYASTGAETVFLNRLDPEARSREVFSFHRPETISGWMREADEFPETPTYRARLKHMPALETSGLRPAQIDAVTGLETSLELDMPRALIQMATGAGKTFTAVTEAYRLLKHGKARRVLFLVDRNNLGRQALAEFRNYVTPDDGRKFNELYNVERLAGDCIQDSSSVLICTIQKMYALLRGEVVVNNDAEDDAAEDSDADYETDAPVAVGYNPRVPPESFDLIVVDECHRSIYGLWRGVLDYFDAHIVGLTATPTKQTLGFFNQNLVSQYTYEMAVADGVNVDFDVVRLSTKVGEEGSLIEEGTTVRVRNRATRAQRLEQLDSDFIYGKQQLGRNVIAEDHIRTVLTTYRDNWQRWFPDRQVLPKTLVFAATDDHAEDVLTIAKQVFSVGDEFAAKITYKVRKAGKNPDDLINDLRQDARLRLAVTVDMIATGTDVRALECVIFLRAVRSAVLFEQMKGRGSRTLDSDELREVTPDASEDIAKTRFILLDAAGVTDSPKVDSKPLMSATDKQISLETLLKKCATRAINLTEAAALAGRLARLNQQITPEEREELATVGNGMTITALASAIVKAIDPDEQEKARESGGKAAARKLVEEAIAPLTGNPAYRERILEIRRDHDITYDATTKDEVRTFVEVPREERAGSTVESWHAYLEKHRDEITAIQVLSKSRGGGRDALAKLKALAAKIKRPPHAWTPGVLWDAYETLGRAADSPLGNAEVPDLVSLIRYELGLDSDLKPYRSVVEERFAAWLLRQEQAGTAFTPDQRWWLERIKDEIAIGVGITVEAIKGVTFTPRGGQAGLVRDFGGRDRARELIDEMDRELA
ncbi:DEAD/DEAH box helicase family protein [Nonomuraea sp. SMC257]|uniref:DEAD/DEAH box helicase family protein n=1 Tax=Nonomuraea montanisoli TaxID=2741721 RepID=A0A7Y6M776_9ACTN|nr:DEAD/DEAH box helicase family protein [Nonomuraea montanisoli]NUW37127.1 DEAD/DEAH box helicase family protein [Nonomuraea montanisoli]